MYNANQADNTEKSFKIIDDDDPTITISLSNSSINENKEINTFIGNIKVDINDQSFNLTSTEIVANYDHENFDILSNRSSLKRFLIMRKGINI